MDFAAWRRRLEAQQGGLVAWAPSTSPPARRQALARMLRAYAESEGAEREIAAALLRGASDTDDRTALELLLEDERRHASILLEAAGRLEGLVPGEGGSSGPAASPRIERLVTLMRPFGFVDTLVVFHLFEIAAVAVYRLLRACNRRDPLIRGALGLVLRDEVAHTSFHEARIVEALAAAGRLGRIRMRGVHLLAARLVILNERSVVAHEVYPVATGLSFGEFNARVIRAYERAYSGRLAYLRTGA